jgi:hypothetical protein
MPLTAPVAPSLATHPPHNSAVEFDTVYVNGVKKSLFTDEGALAVLHGTLQSAIGTLTDAEPVERRYGQLRVERQPG